jgi:DNA repair protein RAD5
MDTSAPPAPPTADADAAALAAARRRAEELWTSRFSHCRFDGKMAQKDRAATVQRFASRRGPRILLVSLKAGGVGLNLTCANVVVLMDPWSVLRFLPPPCPSFCLPPD